MLKIFEFDVASEKVSMHIPILRFLAGKPSVILCTLLVKTESYQFLELF